LVLRPVRDIIAYDPKPLAKPLVDEALDELGFLHRSAETIRYNLACLELRLWPGGHLRAYVWLILSLLLGFAIPAAACLLALTVVTPIFGYAAAILGFVENGTRSAMMATLYVVGTIVLGLVGLHIAKSLFRAWQRRPVGNGVRRLRD